MFEFLNPQIVYFKPNDFDSDTFLSDKYKSFLCNNEGFNPTQFFDEVFLPLGYDTLGSNFLYVNGFDMFKYEVHTSFSWNDLNMPFFIRYNLDYKLNNKIKLRSIEYQNYSLNNEENAYQVVKNSTTKNHAPFGYGSYDEGVFVYNIPQTTIEIFHLSDVEQLVEMTKEIFEKTKKDLEMNIKIYEMLKTDQFQDKFKELKQQQKQLTQAKKDLMTKTAKTVMNIVSMGEDF